MSHDTDQEPAPRLDVRRGEALGLPALEWRVIDEPGMSALAVNQERVKAVHEHEAPDRCGARGTEDLLAAFNAPPPWRWMNSLTRCTSNCPCESVGSELSSVCHASFAPWDCCSFSTNVRDVPRSDSPITSSGSSAIATSSTVTMAAARLRLPFRASLACKGRNASAIQLASNTGAHSGRSARAAPAPSRAKHQ